MKNWTELGENEHETREDTGEKKKEQTRKHKQKTGKESTEPWKIKHNKNEKVIFQKQHKQSIIRADTEMILNARFEAQPEGREWAMEHEKERKKQNKKLTNNISNCWKSIRQSDVSSVMFGACTSPWENTWIDSNCKQLATIATQKESKSKKNKVEK